ncbi:hypothetical protein HQ545_06170 [Candidatus Woesearchaeota archaeon]|nr:hypothetical protein [Candidatus Woesearchaeota archaeon]
MDIDKLKIAISESWDVKTCYPPMRKDWSLKNPAYGQCHCSMLVVNDYFGGQIRKYKFDDGTAHFSNYIEGKEVDLTRIQFDKGEKFPEPEMIERKDTKNTPEYLLLKERVERFIAD